jgi:methionyl aminopeptidase
LRTENKLFFRKSNIEIKTPAEIDKMRIVGKVVGEILENLSHIIKPGISTKDIDKFAQNYIKSKNMSPAFLGVAGVNYPFPATACVSINDEVVHGIPSHLRKIKDGDIVSVDVGAIYNGYYGDAARTYPVGSISQSAAKLLEITERSLYESIKFALAGNRLGDISNAVQRTVEAAGFSIVRDFVGHGIGRDLHEDPPIPNFGQAGSGIKLIEGMVLAIEPMVNIGAYQVEMLDNDWTIVTKDGSLSAHFEHTVFISANGNEILTKV